jgi:hypothetical protein
MAHRWAVAGGAGGVDLVAQAVGVISLFGQLDGVEADVRKGVGDRTIAGRSGVGPRIDFSRQTAATASYTTIPGGFFELAALLPDPHRSAVDHLHIAVVGLGSQSEGVEIVHPFQNSVWFQFLRRSGRFADVPRNSRRVCQIVPKLGAGKPLTMRRFPRFCVVNPEDRGVTDLRPPRSSPPASHCARKRFLHGNLDSCTRIAPHRPGRARADRPVIFGKISMRRRDYRPSRKRRPTRLAGYKHGLSSGSND